MYCWLNSMPLKSLLGSSWMTLRCTSLISVNVRQWIWDEVLITHLLYLRTLGIIYLFIFCPETFIAAIFCLRLCVCIRHWPVRAGHNYLERQQHWQTGTFHNKYFRPCTLVLYNITALSSSSSMFRLSHCLSYAVQIMWFTCTPVQTPVLL